MVHKLCRLARCNISKLAGSKSLPRRSHLTSGATLDTTQVLLLPLSQGCELHCTSSVSASLADLAGSAFALGDNPSATACSGGGLRASLYCAGTISALDSRNSTTLGPLLQLSDYLTGLSGGSWAVSSLALNDLPTVPDLVLGMNGQDGWLLDLDILAPGGALVGTLTGQNSDYYDSLREDVRDKTAIGAPASIVDLWGLALGRHFYNGSV